MKLQFCFILFHILLIKAFPIHQEKKIKGFANLKNSNETLIGATIFNKTNGKGTITNSHGFYCLNAEKNDTLIISFTGCKKEELVITDSCFNNILITSLTSNNQIKEIIVDKNSPHDINNNGLLKPMLSSIKKIPVILGEPDLFKILQLLPGVQQGTEGTSHIFVRGGDPWQNLLLIDDVPIYNSNHLLGFFSVVNTEVLKNCTMYKGGFPSKFNGRISSVIDLKLNDGNSHHLKGGYQIGLLMSKCNIEGPLPERKGSFSIAMRRTMLDLLFTPVNAMINKNYLTYHFGDMNAKINYKFNNENRLFVNTYLNSDQAKDNNIASKGMDKYNFMNTINWGNYVASVRWNHIFKNSSFLNTTVYYSDYHYDMKQSEKISGESLNEQKLYNYTSGIQDYGFKTNYENNITSLLKLNLGLNIKWQQFNIGTKLITNDNVDTFIKPSSDVTSPINAIECMGYSELCCTPFPFLNLNLGANANAFIIKNNKFYSIDPRIVTKINLSSSYSVNASFSKMSQNLHLISNNTIGMPTDYWLPAQDHLKPEKALQYSIGVSRKQTHWLVSVEGYYKQMNNLITYSDGISFSDGLNNQLNNVLVGKGISKGIEIYLEKKSDKLTGWCSYTLSKSTRTFNKVNNGNSFPFTYDRRHNLAIALMFKWSEKIHLSANWIFMSGYYVTLPIHTYPVLNDTKIKLGDDLDIDYIYSRNNYQTPPYHRLDLGVSFKKRKRKGIRTWYLGVYNAYNRINPFYISIEKGYTDYNNNIKTKPRIAQTALFPILPSISYSYNFY